MESDGVQEPADPAPVVQRLQRPGEKIPHEGPPFLLEPIVGQAAIGDAGPGIALPDHWGHLREHLGVALRLLPPMAFPRISDRIPRVGFRVEGPGIHPRRSRRIVHPVPVVALDGSGDEIHQILGIGHGAVGIRSRPWRVVVEEHEDPHARGVGVLDLGVKGRPVPHPSLRLDGPPAHHGHHPMGPRRLHLREPRALIDAAIHRDAEGRNICGIVVPQGQG
ncbi:MAG: hypothetical protein C4327_11960 [Meiothermus sp.]